MLHTSGKSEAPTTLSEASRAFIRELAASRLWIPLAPQLWCALALAISTVVGSPESWLLGIVGLAHALVPTLALVATPRDPWRWFVAGAAGLVATYIVLCAMVVGAPCADPYCAESQPVAGAVMATLFVVYLLLASALAWVVSGIANVIRPK